MSSTRAHTGVVAIAFAIAASCAFAPGAPSARAADSELTIRAQQFNLTRGGTLNVTIGLPAGVDSSTLGDGAVISVTSHPLLEHRESFLAAVDGTLGDSDDEFELSLDPADTAAAAFITRPSADSLGLSVPTATTMLDKDVVDRDAPDTTTTTPTTTTNPTTSTTSPDDATVPGEPGAEPQLPAVGLGTLQFYDPGVHAVEIELSIRNRRVARAITFVNIADPDQSFGDMSVSLLMGQQRQPTVNDDGTVSVSTDDTDEMARLADTLAAIDALPAALGLADARLPRGVFVQPAMLEAITASDAALAARLTPGLTASEILAGPRLPFEPSAAAAARQADKYGELLSDGQDLLSALLPGAVIDRDVHLVHKPFTTEAAALARQVGARLMVMDFDFYNSAEGGNGMLTDTSQLVSIALPGGSTVPTAVIDPFIAERMDNGVEQPMLTSIEMVADLLVIAHSIDDAGGDVSRHGMVVARSDVGVPDTQLTSDLMSLLATTAGVRLVDPNVMVSTVDSLRQPGGSNLAITLPAQQPADLDARVALIDEISAEILSFASMLPDDAPQVDGWLQVLKALPSTAVNDDSATTMVDGLRNDFGVYTAGIHGPSPFTFTLTGRTNTLTFSLSNTTATDLDVRVRLSSPKLTFPDGDVLVTLPAGGETEINVRAEALSNGKSSVFLRVYAPAENSDLQLIPETVLTARVSSLAGVGQLVTGVGLLLLLTWWGRHWQQTRRKRIATENLGRHPSNGSAVDLGDDLAPDAAASSLPPS